MDFKHGARSYYEQLDQRIAPYRKAQGLPQVQLAEILGIAQQTLTHYEGGRLRIAVSMPAAPADVLVTVHGVKSLNYKTLIYLILPKQAPN